jgi:hypothetical protein
MLARIKTTRYQRHIWSNKMKSDRKIEIVGRTVSFAQAEEDDDRFWANATFEERWNELVSLRWMVFGDKNSKPVKIAKVVKKRSLYEEDDES